MHPEDAEIIENLAKLQQMHRQIHDLRSLLPNALIGPAREAISQPRGANPTQISVALIKAAEKGRHDIQSFKHDWQHEKTRQLFKEVNAANTPQSSDTWQTDYQILAKTGDRTAETEPQGEDAPFDSIDEANAAFENFNKPERKIKFERSDPSNPFPLDAEVNRMHFRVERDEASNTYRIGCVTSGSLPQQIRDQLTQNSSCKKLNKLLVRNSCHIARSTVLTDSRHTLKLTTTSACGNATNVQVS